MQTVKPRWQSGRNALAAPAVPLTASQARYLKGARRLSRFMDTQWGVGPVRLGADSIIGLVPGVGDVVSAGASLYQLWVAKQLGVPAPAIGRMVRNVGVDLALGLVPFVGDMADIAFKSHIRNQRIIDEHALGMETSATPGRRRR